MAAAAAQPKAASGATHRYVDEPRDDGEPALSPTLTHTTSNTPGSFDTDRALHSSDGTRAYRLYKRRFFGLAQLTLLNIIVSWDWLTFAASSTTSARYFGITQGAINWLSTGFLFAFVVATPATIWTLNRGGPKTSIVVASTLILLGNWIRYGGARARQHSGTGVFGVVVFGQLLIGFAQPFVLAAPTRYSDLWFSEKGRITATAIASLANPLGGALGQLIDPFWISKPSEVPNAVLYVAVISTVCCVPSFFIPARPPVPPSATSTAALNASKITVAQLRALFTQNRAFHLMAIPFVVYVSTFNATSSLLNQILEPYGFSEDQAGITGALLILVGLVSAALTSPILDRRKALRLPAIWLTVPVIAAMYLALVFAPGTRSVAAPYAICAILGAASFSLVPLALELLVEIAFEQCSAPEVSSSICWAGGQLGGGILIVIMDAMKGVGRSLPPQNMYYALVLQAVVAWVIVPLPMMIGWFGIGWKGRSSSFRI